ncbi:MAG: hypothetical protein K5790_10285 [Nitrosopumilus sp.]|uniref:hypothetical protein n=1 Tax=Nitrosopumilus sp. TaxID=2024843 RepID=UPI00247BF9D1|nr:hypothetical protein [Nitrosopumilus sp.]MCV0393657.1 hypothetical protein [Nitrosopumilus sp.]
MIFSSSDLKHCFENIFRLYQSSKLSDKYDSLVQFEFLHPVILAHPTLLPFEIKHNPLYKKMLDETIERRHFYIIELRELK